MLSFTQESCLRSINADLHHYYRFLSAQPLLNTTVLSSIKELMQVIYLSIYLHFMLFFKISWKFSFSQYMFPIGMLCMELWVWRSKGKWCYILNCTYSNFFLKNWYFPVFIFLRLLETIKAATMKGWSCAKFWEVSKSEPSQSTELCST